ncbi:MAG: hypothetical protein ACFFDK_03535 [Promethearchaeota archaeon]
MNNVLKDSNMRKPSILLIRANLRKRVFKVLTEGLASYGFNVVNITLNIKSSLKRFSFEKQFQDKSQNLFTSILNFLKEKQLINNSSYYTIIDHKSKVLYNSILFDENNLGMILINPKINIITQKIITTIKEQKELLSKLYIIFSKKSSLFLPNKDLKDIMTCSKEFDTLSSNLQILDKSRGSFKFYETILLGIIINMIESNILKSSILS